MEQAFTNNAILNSFFNPKYTLKSENPNPTPPVAFTFSNNRLLSDRSRFQKIKKVKFTPEVELSSNDYTA